MGGRLLGRTKAEEAANPRPAAPAPARSGPPTAADLFPEPLSETPEEHKMTAEQLFGPDVETPLPPVEETTAEEPVGVSEAAPAEPGSAEEPGEQAP